MYEVYSIIGQVVVGLFLMVAGPMVLLGIPTAVILRIKRGYWGDSPEAILRYVQKKYGKAASPQRTDAWKA